MFGCYYSQAACFFFFNSIFLAVSVIFDFISPIPMFVRLLQFSGKKLLFFLVWSNVSQFYSFCFVDLILSSGDSSDADRKRDCPFCLLEKRIARSLSSDLQQDAPAKIQSCLRIFSEQFRGGRQEDAHEFLRYVIDACHNTCLRLKKLRRIGNGSTGAGSGGGGASVVKEIFGGALQSQVKCLSCGTESNKVDEIMDISLDVLHSNSLKDALQRFFQPEVLDGSNKYKCERYHPFFVFCFSFFLPSFVVIY